MSRCRHGTRGFSLTEMLVAMVIGLFILGGLVALMVSSRTSYEVQDYSARLQENARFAMEFLMYDIRMAGYMGCSSNVVNDTVAQNAVNDGTYGDSFTFEYANPTDNDIFIASIADISGSPNIWTLNNVPSEWGTDNDPVGEEVVVSDCGSAAITTITAADVSQKEITVETDLGRVFDPSGPLQIGVRRLETVTYEIRSDGPSGIPALFRDGVELVEGIENLQVLFRTVGASGYQAENGTIAGRLMAVQLGVMARSVSNAGDDEKEYGSGSQGTTDDGVHTLLGTDLNLGTLRGQRRAFSSTVHVRNSNL